MDFSFLTEENIFDLCGQAEEHTKRLTESFPEHARIARNKPHPKTPKRFPKTTDGTSASMIAKTPRRAVQQLPSGVIKSDLKHSPYPILADFVYREKILPLANTEYDLIRKCWTTMEDGATFGAKAIYTPMIDHDGEVTPDYLPIYWGDIFLQPGKKSGYDCNYLFMRSWWQESDVDELIESERARKKEAKEKGEPYESYWDLAALEEIKEAIVQKDDTARTPAEDELGLDPSGIEIVTGFQRGKGATFYTFNPSQKKILKRKPNKDPRGKTQIDWYYHDIDGSNPLGRSLLDFIGPLQNLIDSDMQAYQYNRAISLQPPINVYGNVDAKRVVYAPNVINRVQDPQGRIEAMEISTDAIRDYPNLYGLQVSQLMKNTNGDPATAISAEVGDPLAGKTPTAIKSRNASTSTDDNATRKGWEAFFENWSETAINLYFGERSGKEDMQLDEETANKLRDLEKEGHLPQGYVRDDNTVTVDFDEAIEALHFRVNASTSKVSEAAEQLEALQVLVTTLDGSQALSEVVPISKKLAVWNAIVANSGVEKADDLKVTEEELAEMQTMQAAQAEAAAAGQAGMVAAEGIPEEDMAAEELPLEGEMPEELPVPSEAEEDEQIAAEMRELGVPEDLIAEVPMMIDKGYSEDEVMAAIQGVLSKETEEVAHV